MKPQLIDLRRTLSRDGKKLNHDDLIEWELDIREFYLEMDRALHALPDMRNTDDEPLEFHKLSYDIDSANF